MDFDLIGMVSGGLAIAAFILLRVERVRNLMAESIRRAHARIDNLPDQYARRDDVVEVGRRIDNRMGKFEDRLTALHDLMLKHFSDGGGRCGD